MVVRAVVVTLHNLSISFTPILDFFFLLPPPSSLVNQLTAKLHVPVCFVKPHM